MLEEMEEVLNTGTEPMVMLDDKALVFKNIVGVVKSLGRVG